MYGIGIGTAVTAWFFILFLFPLVLAASLAWVIWPITIGYLVLHSPNKRRFKWWLFMPIGSLAASVVGCLKAGLILWVPMLLCFRIWPPSDQSFTWSNVFYVGISCSWSALFSTVWVMKLDENLHRD